MQTIKTYSNIGNGNSLLTFEGENTDFLYEDKYNGPLKGEFHLTTYWGQAPLGKFNYGLYIV